MNLEQIEADMKMAISWMMAHGSLSLIRHEEVLPIAHLFKTDGKSEIIGLYFQHTEEDMNEVADALKAKLSLGQYVGALLLFNGSLSNLTNKPKTSDASIRSVLMVSYQTHMVSEMYVLPYDVSAKGIPSFKKIEKMEPIPGNKFFELFPKSINC
jgi:hypothetical protein